MQHEVHDARHRLDIRAQLCARLIEYTMDGFQAHFQVHLYKGKSTRSCKDAQFYGFHDRTSLQGNSNSKSAITDLACKYRQFQCTSRV